jgi:hypothetical protein
MSDQLVDQLKRKNSSTVSNLKVAEPYFNECILAAERMKNNRRSERDRQICYENLILAEKLERIKTQSGQNAKKNLEKDHCRLLLSKAINKRKQSTLFNETEIISYHSPSLSDTSSSQATEGDVDATIEYSDATPPVVHQKRREINSSKNYQHLTNIDMSMIKDASPLVRSPSSKHFSICILPHFDNDRPRAFKKEILYK